MFNGIRGTGFVVSRRREPLRDQADPEPADCGGAGDGEDAQHPLANLVGHGLPPFRGFSGTSQP